VQTLHQDIRYAIPDGTAGRPKLAVALLFSDIRNSRDRNINLVLSAKKKKDSRRDGMHEGKADGIRGAMDDGFRRFGDIFSPDGWTRK